MIKKLILWILVLACMGTIFFFSSQVAEDSDRTSSTFIANIVRVFDVKNSLTETEIQEICASLNNVVRIGAHFSIYAMLGFLIALLLNEYRLYGGRQLLFTVLFSLAYACSDELHQEFVSGRSAQMSDICTDVLGALCGAVFAMVILVLIKKVREKNNG